MNDFPSGVSCPNATVGGSSCIGWAKYMNGVAFPTTPCDPSLAPFNCPLMSLPWADNFRLRDIDLVADSPYAAQGPSITTLEKALTATRYACPKGTQCGPNGPYPDQ